MAIRAFRSLPCQAVLLSQPEELHKRLRKLPVLAPHSPASPGDSIPLPAW